MSKLIEAKQLLIERGVARGGGLEDADGCLCALGALNMAYTGNSGQHFDEDCENPLDLPYHPTDEEHRADIQRLAAIISLREPRLVEEDDETSYPVWRYNDMARTTDEDILSLFDEAAQL
jgi:hypothetical protein